jgi:heat shock protein HtpX
LNNVTKAWTFLTALSLTLIVLGHMVLGREGLLIGLTLALGINSFVYFYEDRRVVALFKGRLLEGQDPWGLLKIARRLAVKARVPVPKVIVIPEKSPQSLVVGRSFTHGTILITEGLLQRFSEKEIEAIMAYQLASIRTLNTLTFAVGSFICSLLLSFAEALDTILRVLIVEKKNPNYAMSHLFTRLISPLVGLLLRLSIRPNFYLIADDYAAHLIEEPLLLAHSLWKLQSYASTIPLAAPISTAHMFIVNPLPDRGWTRHYQAQPTVEKRIRTLIGYYPV